MSKRYIWIVSVALMGLLGTTTIADANLFNSNSCGCQPRYKYVKHSKWVAKHKWVTKWVKNECGCGCKKIRVKKCYKVKETYYKKVRIGC